MRRKSAGLAAAAILTTALTATLASDAHASRTRPGTAPTWRVAQTNALPGEDTIQAITVAPTGSTWAAGDHIVSGKPIPLVQHLLGGKWTTAKSPSSSLGKITALSASSSKNVWAFGATGKSTTYAARWNGATWTLNTIPSAYYGVQDAVALSSSNVWAVGGDQTRTAMHWTGASWRKVTLPATARAIAAVSSTHVYAAGTYQNQPAVMHWTGSVWKLAATPKLPLPDPWAVGVLNDIYAPSTSNVWAAGGFEWACGEDGDSTCDEPYLLHWNGKAWSTKVFHQLDGYGAFSQVTGDGTYGAGGLWLMRYNWDSVFIHIAGDTVTTVTAPRPSGYDIDLSAMATQGTTIWAAGFVAPEGDPPDPSSNGVYLRTG